MKMISIEGLVVMTMAITFSSGLTISPFEQLAPGVYEAWNGTNPDTVHEAARFALADGDDKVYMIARPLFRPDLSHPWDSASRGGIVSTYRVSQHLWSHTRYDRLDGDGYGERMFWLGNRVFMLTYDIDQGRINYHRLFFWYDGASQWVELVVEMDPLASTITSNALQTLVVNVPDQGGSTAYLVACAHTSAVQSGSEMAFSKLEIDLLDNVPRGARLTSVGRIENRQRTAVIFTAVKNDVIYALVQNYFSEGYVPVFNYVYAIHLQSDRAGNFSKIDLSGKAPVYPAVAERIFQIGHQVLVLGGRTILESGLVAEVKNIFVLDLNTLEWEDRNTLLPDDSQWIGTEYASDQAKMKLYMADLKRGIRVADISV